MSTLGGRTRSRRFCLAFATALFSATPLLALEDPLPDWTSRFHIGGNGDVRFEAGQRNAVYDRNASFDIYQAELVFDVDIAPNWSVWYDLPLAMEDSTATTFREQLYLRRDNVMGLPWLNLKIGQTFTPFGESYLQWNPIANPLASYTVGMLWNIDQGILAFGDIIPDAKLSYAVAVSNGDATGAGGSAFDDNANKTLSVKLMTKPLPWLYASSSFLNSGKNGNHTSASNFAYFSGQPITPLGTTTAGNGSSSPSNIADILAWEQDLKMTFDLTQIWGNFGYMHVMDGGGHQYDRYIKWYTGQLVQYVPKTNKKLYLVGRYSAVGTFNKNLGYRFQGDAGVNGETSVELLPYQFNYDQKDLVRYSAGVGYWFAPNVLGKLEYSWEHTDLIAPAQTAANNAQLGYRNFAVASMSFRF